jgi:hypothetical protein
MGPDGKTANFGKYPKGISETAEKSATRQRQAYRREAIGIVPLPGNIIFMEEYYGSHYQS